MSLQLTGTSSQYWLRPIGLTASALGAQNNTGRGFTYGLWVRAGNISALTSSFTSVVGLASPTSDAFWGFELDPSGDLFNVSISDNFTTGQYANSGTLNQNVWCYFLGYFPNNSYQCFYATVNGETLTTNSNTNNDASTLTNLTIGFQPPGNGFGNANTAIAGIQVAEFSVWIGLLGLNEFRALNGGANPLTIRRDILQWYYPLRGDLQDYGSQGIGLQAQGGAIATYSDHPPVNQMPVYPKRFASITNYASTYYADLAF